MDDFNLLSHRFLWLVVSCSESQVYISQCKREKKYKDKKESQISNMVKCKCFWILDGGWMGPMNLDLFVPLSLRSSVQTSVYLEVFLELVHYLC